MQQKLHSQQMFQVVCEHFMPHKEHANYKLYSVHSTAPLLLTPTGCVWQMATNSHIYRIFQHNLHFSPNVLLRLPFISTWHAMCIHYSCPSYYYYVMNAVKALCILKTSV